MNKIIKNLNYNLSPFFYLTKKYFLKRKRIKYKKYRRLFNQSVYSKLYNHKIYSLNYFVKFIKPLETKLDSIHASQIYFYNFSGLLKHSLVKDTLLYSIYWRKFNNQDDHEKDIEMAFAEHSYFFSKYNVNLKSKFLLSNDSKNYLKPYSPDWVSRRNNYHTNIITMDKNEYEKNFAYYSIIGYNLFTFADIYNDRANTDVDTIIYKNNRSVIDLKYNYLRSIFFKNFYGHGINFFIKRWWGAFWSYKLRGHAIPWKQNTDLFYLNYFQLVLIHLVSRRKSWKKMPNNVLRFLVYYSFLVKYRYGYKHYLD